MSHKELIILLSKETSNSKIFDGPGDKIVNDLLPVPIIIRLVLQFKLRC